ncbi:MAG: preprotein translocase subunit SecG, partial [Lentisphaerae bacterium]|nr:preprotein translocase subunit SecG [Lentisphaerota bacterium]
MWDVIVSILTVIEVLTALLLIGIILIQQSKSGGGLGAMGGAVTETFFGPASGNVMTKITVYLAGIFLGLTLVLAIITGHRKPGRSVVEAYEPDEKPVAEEVVTTEKAADAPASESEATDEAPAADADADADA